MSDNEFEARLKEEFGSLEGPEQTFQLVLRRFTRRRVRRLSALAVVSVGVAASLIWALFQLLPLGKDGTLPSKPGAAAAPHEAGVQCDGSKASIADPTVQAQADGVHVVVTNTGTPLASPEIVGGMSLGGGEGASRETVAVAPGDISIVCRVSATGSVGQPVHLQIVDPAGLWHSNEIECSGAGFTEGATDYIPSSGEGLIGDPVALTGQYVSTFIRQGDEVEYAGYPETTSIRQVRIVRDGRVVGVVSYRATTAGGWVPTGERLCWG